MHHYFHVHTTDLAVMREQANALTRPNSKWGRDATPSVIHKHPSSISCRGQEHEFYALPGDEDLSKRFWEAVEEAEEMESVK